MTKLLVVRQIIGKTKSISPRSRKVDAIWMLRMKQSGNPNVGYAGTSMMGMIGILKQVIKVATEYFLICNPSAWCRVEDFVTHHRNNVNDSRCEARRCCLDACYK